MNRPGDDRGEGQVVGLNEKVVDIKRVVKVVKGGRHFSFNALVVVGDGAGRVGIGLGKAGEVPEAVRKGGSIARRRLLKVPMKESTIPHALISKYGAAKVILKPAAPGTGIIAGGSVRAVVTAAGIRDILTKSLGSSNPINLVKATYYALEQLRDPTEAVAERKKLAAALAASPPPEPRSPRPPRPPRPRQPREPVAEERPRSEAPAAPVAEEQPQSEAPAAPVAEEQPRSEAPEAPVAEEQPQSEAPAAPAEEEQPQSEAPAAPVAEEQPQSEAPEAPAEEEQPQSEAPETPVAEEQPQSEAPEAPAEEEQPEPESDEDKDG